MNTLFDRMWPDLEEKLNTVSKAAPTGKPKRTFEDMVGELLELARSESINRKRLETTFALAGATLGPYEGLGEWVQPGLGFADFPPLLRGLLTFEDIKRAFELLREKERQARFEGGREASQ